MESFVEKLITSGVLKKISLCGGIMLAIALGGCGPVQLVVTPTPIYVTATQIAELLTPTDTATPVIAPVATALAGPTVTRTPIRLEPTLTPSFTLTFTDSPAPSRKAPVCKTAPQGGFATIYGKDPALQAALGCAASPAVAIPSASQSFEGGRMVWVGQLAELPTKVIYVVYNSGTYQRYDDTWVENVDPATGSDVPPPGKAAPVRGFGKVWRSNLPVKSGLGWANGAEAGTSGQIERFERGEMLFVAGLGQTYVFVNGNTWRVEQIPF